MVGELHADEVIHVRAESFFGTQSHFRRQRRLAMKKIGERSAAHFQNLRRFDTVRPSASMTSVLSPGWDGFFMGIAASPSCAP